MGCLTGCSRSDTEPMRGLGIGRGRAFVALVVLLLTAAGCGSAGPTIPPEAPRGQVTATAVDGRFQVTFTIDRGVVASDEAITGTAKLELLIPGGVTLTGSDQVFGFDFLEVGGERRQVAPARDGACSSHRLTGNTPIVSPIVKTGATTGGPNDGFINDFLQGPDVRLPKGTWDVSAIAFFVDGQACQGAQHTIEATVRVYVTE